MEQRIDLRGRLGRLRETAQDSALALRHRPEDDWRHSVLAALQAITGEYESTCQQYFVRSGATRDASVADRLAKVCLLRPNSDPSLAGLDGLAASKLAQDVPRQTLQPTALVHEAWLRLIGDRNPNFKNRAHFFRAGAEAMRHILIDRARRKRTHRHGGGYQWVTRDELEVADDASDDRLLALDEALEKLVQEHLVQADLIKLRYFAGITNEEVADALGIWVSTAKNYWTFLRTWLLHELESR